METRDMEIKLFDGFLLDRGFFPIMYDRGFAPPGMNRAYVVTPGCIKHELYGMLLRDTGAQKYISMLEGFLPGGTHKALLRKFGVQKAIAEANCADEDCFAANGVEYDPHAGLCEKHSELIANLEGKLRLNIRNTLFCGDGMKDGDEPRDGLIREVGDYEREFSEQTGIGTAPLTVFRKRPKPKDGEWLIIHKYMDEIATGHDFNRERGAVAVYKLVSLEPYRTIEEYEKVHKTRRA